MNPAPQNTPFQRFKVGSLWLVLSLLLAWGGAALAAPVANNQTVSIVTTTVLSPVILDPTLSSVSTITYKLIKAPTSGTLSYKPKNATTYSAVPLNTVIGANVTDDFIINFTHYTGLFEALWNYTANPGFVGTDSFQWQVMEGSVASGIATCTLNVKANTAPAVSTTRVVCNPNSSASFSPNVYDADAAVQVLTPLLVAAPSHGAMAVSGSTFTYTPAANYTGEDAFTYKVNDGFADSPVCSGRIQVRANNARAGSTVLLLVNNLLLPNISSEVNRLASDLTSEGYTPKIATWNTSGSTALQVWSYLRTEYQNQNQWLTGAILIGDLPKPKGNCYNETLYWNMDQWQSDTSKLVKVITKHIWVSRISADNETYGSEVTLIKRALDSNHACRTGASRLPQTAYKYKNPEWWKSVNYLVNAWPTVESRGADANNLHFLNPPRLDLNDPSIDGVGDVLGADCFVKGGDLFEEESHGSATDYMGNSGWFTPPMNYRILPQVRTVLVGSCVSGAYGGIANQQISARGGGNVLSIACTANSIVGETVISQNSAICGLLGSGESWGMALLRKFCIGGEGYNTYFGDLSIGNKPTPNNAIPTVTFAASNLNPKVGEPVSFDIAVSDADAGQTVSANTPNEFQVEWFLKPSPTASGTDSYNAGRNTPTLVTTAGHDDYLTNSAWRHVTQTYTSPRSFIVRAEVMDQWMARGWQELTVNVQPDFLKPFRIDCGGTSDSAAADGYAWLFESQFTAGRWGWTTPSGTLPTVVAASPVTGTSYSSVFQSAAAVPADSNSCPTYKVTVPNGKYLVNLGFADLWSSGAGQRLVNVYVEEKQVLYGFDAFASAGASNTAVTKTIPVTVTDGELRVRFERNIASQSDAFINAIEIVPADPATDYAPVVCAGADIQVLDSDNNATQPVTLSAGSSYDADGSILSYVWSEGGVSLGSGASLTVSLAVGDHLITLTATDIHGNTSSDQLVVKVVGYGTVDYLTQILPANVADLSYKMVTFTPNSSPSGYSVAITPISGFPSPLSQQVHYSLSDDGSVWLPAPAGKVVKLFGQSYSQFSVNSNGNISFDATDPGIGGTATAHFLKKRISALFRDLNPNKPGAAVMSRVYPDRITVTWLNVPQYLTTNSNNFQIELFFDGTIRIAYMKVEAASGLIGLSRGSGVPADFAQSNYANYTLRPDVAAVSTATSGGNWASTAWQPASPVPGSLTTIVFNNTAAAATTNDQSIFNLNQLKLNQLAVTLGGDVLLFDGPNAGITTGSGNAHVIANEVALNQNITCSTAGGSLKLSNLLTGAFSVTKAGAGTLELSSPNNDYSGGTTISAGSLYYSANGALGTGDVKVASGAALSFRTGATSIANNLTIAGTGPGSGGALALTDNVDLNCTGTLTLSANARISLGNTAGVNWKMAGPVNLGAFTLSLVRGTGTAAQSWAMSGPISGSGGLTYDFSASGSSLTISGTNTYTGVTTVSGAATLKVANANALQFSTLDTGAANATKTVAFTAAGTSSYNLGGLQGSDDLAIGANTLVIGANDANTSYAAVLSGVAGGIRKVGLGILTLSGANTYTGATVVESGTLALSGGGSLANSASFGVADIATLKVSGRTDGTLSLGSAQTLSGRGTVVGTVVNAGIVAPGSPLGILTLQGKYTQSTGALSVNLSGAANPGVDYGQLSVSGTATIGGTLNVNLTGGFTPQAGNSFVVLQSAGLSGGFGTVNLPALASGLSWSVTYPGNSVVITVLSGWTAFAAQIVDSTKRGGNDDADGDGYANLIEYATGGNASSADSMGQVKATRSAGALELVFTRNTAAADLTLVVESSANLASATGWTAIATYSGGAWSGPATVTETGSGANVTVTVRDTSTAGAQGFLRLRVVAP